MKLDGHVAIEVGSESKLTLDHLKNYIASALIQEEAKSVDTEEDKINFKVGVFRPFANWKILACISSGIIMMRSEKNFIHVNYQLSFKHLIIIATLMVVLIFLLDLNGFVASPFKLLFLIFGWGWLVFGNIITVAFRFPRFINKCASNAGKIEYIKFV
jgi:hypothetical protein